MKSKVIIAGLSFLLIIGSLSTMAQKVNHCSTTEYTEKMMETNPEFAINQAELERFTKEFTKSAEAQKGVAVVKIIPVVFHIIHNYGSENIPKERILEQIRILNEDFRRLNPDTVNTKAIYKGRAVDTEIEFRLARIDPQGNCTDGILRIVSPLTYDGDDRVKALSYWPNNKYMNVWVVASIGSSSGGSVTLGYSQFPGGGNSTDGVVMNYSVIGDVAGFNNYGRTLVHEFGHSLNLRHTWGDANCGNDMVDDVPPSTGPNSGCPNNKTSTCAGNTTIDMSENYMDYTDGACENMFSAGQNTRMQAVLNSTTNGRNNLWSDANLMATGTHPTQNLPSCAPKVAINRSTNLACAGNAIKFSAGITNGEPTYYQWIFEGGTPATSTDSLVYVSYASPGKYFVKLKAGNPQGADSILTTNLITILEKTGTELIPVSQNFEEANINFTIDNPTGTTKWERTDKAGYESANSFYIRNFSGNTSGAIDGFILPPFNLKDVPGNELSLKFALAYAPKNIGTEDILKISISKNCGSTYEFIYNQGGTNLSTVLEPLTSEFIPSTKDEWRLEELDMSNFIGEENILIKFENISDLGNNMYIDNLNLSIPGTIGIQQEIANNLFMKIYPNPIESTSTLRFELALSANVKLAIFDVLGRELSTLENNKLNSGTHSYSISKENSGISESGIYIVKLSIDGVEYTTRIVMN